MKRLHYIFLLALLCIPQLFAQSIMDLRKCIELGLERNYSIRIVRNEQRISDNNATLGNAGYLPTVDLSSGYSGSVNNNRENLADGTVNRVNDINSETGNIGLNMNWTIFDGFGIQATHSRLKELQMMGELNTRMTIEDFIATVSAEYYNLIRQKTRLHNLSATLALSKERLRIVEERYYIGSMSRLDLQQAQVYFNADSSNLINQLEALHASRTRLNRLMVVDNVDAPIMQADSTIVPNPFLDEIELWNNTLSSNTSLLMANSNKRVSEFDFKRAKSRDYPYLRLNAGYGYTANWYDRGNVDLQQRLGLSYGVTVGINIFDGFNRRREQRNARIQIENQDLQMQNLELALRTDMSNLWMAYRNNLELWSLEKENLVAAQENYAIAMERYRLGDLSGIELREAQNSLLSAEERRSIAEYATKICEISLLQLSGQIMSYGIGEIPVAN
jgi:Outer membrane protein